MDLSRSQAQPAESLDTSAWTSKHSNLQSHQLSSSPQTHSENHQMSRTASLMIETEHLRILDRSRNALSLQARKVL